jgi:uncharacterized membrane protein YhaH (DUF805 family)
MSIRAVLLTFHGRINRAKFWTGWGISLLTLIGLFFIGFGIDQALLNQHMLPALISKEGRELDSTAFIVLWMIADLILAAYMTLAVFIKRLHDRGKSGWWYWMVLFPIIGQIWLIAECGVFKGRSGPNRFGPDPLLRAA